MEVDIDGVVGIRDLGKDMPKKLWVRGKWDIGLFKKAVAIVGSRRMTQYGQRVVEMLVPRLVQDGFTIVSGFMYGVDKRVHEETLKCGGKTVAVLGWGISEKLESSDQGLADKIVDSGGLIMSEWESQKGALWTFPRRNRIVVAISHSVYVIEAGIKSGSLITVEWAEKLKREIWAVPGPVTSRVSEGTNMLIAQGRAKLWLPQIDKRSTYNTDIYTLLQNEVLSLDEIAVVLRKQIDILSAELMGMQLQGIVEERGGKFFVIH